MLIKKNHSLILKEKKKNLVLQSRKKTYIQTFLFFFFKEDMFLKSKTQLVKNKKTSRLQHFLRLKGKRRSRR